MKELSKSTFSTCMSVFMFSHEDSLSTPGTFSSNFFYYIILKFVEFINFRIFIFLFVNHLYHQELVYFASAFAACFAFSLAAFSSSNIFFLSSFESLLSIRYLGSC